MLSTVAKGARQAQKLTVFHAAWAILLAISTAANVQFCLTLSGNGSLENALWAGAGLAVELLIACLPFKLREQFNSKRYALMLPTAGICALAAIASLYAGLSFASLVREEGVAHRAQAVKLSREIEQLRTKPTVAQLQPQLDVLLADRKLGGCKVIRSKWGRQQCSKVADLKSQIATAANNSRLLSNKKSRLRHISTDGVTDSSTVDPGSAYVVALLSRAGVTTSEADVRLSMTTGIVVMIWLGVLFGGLIANPYRPEDAPVTEAVEQANDNDTPDAGTPEVAKVVSLRSVAGRTKSQKAIAAAMNRSNGVLSGSKAAIARAARISRGSIDRAVDGLVASGEAVCRFDGKNLHIAAA